MRKPLRIAVLPAPRHSTHVQRVVHSDVCIAGLYTFKKKEMANTKRIGNSRASGVLVAQIDQMENRTSNWCDTHQSALDVIVETATYEQAIAATQLRDNCVEQSRTNHFDTVPICTPHRISWTI